MNKKIEFEFVKKEIQENEYSELRKICKAFGNKGADLVGKITSGKAQISTQNHKNVDLTFSSWYKNYEQLENTFSYSAKYYQIEALDETGKSLGCFQYKLQSDHNKNYISIWDYNFPNHSDKQQVAEILLNAMDEIAKNIDAKFIIGSYPSAENSEIFKNCNYQMSKDSLDHHDHILLKGAAQINDCKTNFLSEVKVIDENPNVPIWEGEEATL
ncbi:MAG: hypothetical protein IJA69_05275 [Clostridia bacterium]|nr:hypothetical protein [Clostridia bacterium]